MIVHTLIEHTVHIYATTIYLIHSIVFRYAPNKDHTPSLAAGVEGKLKEKLESVGLAMLCLSLSAANPVATIS